MLLAVPNFSEGRSLATIDAVTAAFTASSELLDRHSDTTHNRTVLTLAPEREAIATTLLAGARACVERIDMSSHEGAHPCVGALDVCPVVWTAPDEEATAGGAALEAAAAIGEMGLPVFLYGELAADPQRRERAFFRRGGLAELSARMVASELSPDFGPAKPHPTAGATLVTARPPLAAFNLLLDSGDVEVARHVAAGIRETSGGLPGVRAIGIDLDGRAQVSTNVHDPIAVPLAAVIERVRALAAEHGARPTKGEIVGLVPEAAIRGLPEDLPLPGFDPERHVIERRAAPHPR